MTLFLGYLLIHLYLLPLSLLFRSNFSSSISPILISSFIFPSGILLSVPCNATTATIFTVNEGLAVEDEVFAVLFVLCRHERERRHNIAGLTASQMMSMARPSEGE